MSDCSTNAWKPPESLTDAYKAGRLEAENAKLRGLCRDMYWFMDVIFGDFGVEPKFTSDDGKLVLSLPRFRERMEELGVEV